MAKLLIRLLLSFLYTPASWSDTVLDNEIQHNLAATTGIITFLTSQESVSAGTYAVEQTGDNASSSSFSTFKLPYRHSYPAHDDSSRWSMLLGYGRFDMSQQLDVTSGQADSSWQANSLSAGIGYSKDLNPDVRWFLSLELAYSQIHHRYALPASNRQLGNVHFDWKTNTLSLIPAAGLRLPLFPEHTNWQFETKAVYLHTQSIYAKSQIEEVTSHSGLWVNKIDFGEPWQISMNTWGVAINPQINRTDAYGEIHEALATAYWYEANLNFRLKSYQKNWWHNLSYGFSYLQGKHFRGGQLSIEFTLDELLPTP